MKKSESLFLWLSVTVSAIFIAAVSAAVMHRLTEPLELSEEDFAFYVPEYELDAPVFEPAASSTAVRSAFPLIRPPLEYLARVAQDPKPQNGEANVRIPVLMYHHIRPMLRGYSQKDRRYTVTPEAFASQMESFVQAGYRTITPADFRRALEEGQGVLPPKPVLLTFDDGFRNQFIHAFPVLKRLGLQATFFLISKESLRAHLTDEMVREMAESGLITIAAHTRHHPHLARLSAAARRTEIAGSKADLEKLIGRDVKEFAFPFGSWSPQVAREVREAGFDLGFGIGFGSLHASSSRFNLRRIRVLNGEDVVALADAFSVESP